MTLGHHGPSYHAPLCHALIDEPNGCHRLCVRKSSNRTSHWFACRRGRRYPQRLPRETTCGANQACCASMSHSCSLGFKRLRRALVHPEFTWSVPNQTWMDDQNWLCQCFPFALAYTPYRSNRRELACSTCILRRWRVRRSHLQPSSCLRPCRQPCQQRSSFETFVWVWDGLCSAFIHYSAMTCWFLRPFLREIIFLINILKRYCLIYLFTTNHNFT